MAIIVGDNQDNVIEGTLADEVILAGGGSDTINAGGGDDLVVAGSGDDTVDAGDGNDVVLAGSGDDTVNAGDGNDLVLAGGGDDTIDGGGGSDIVHAGGGNDTVIHVEGDNLDAENWYFGGKGMDTLRLVVSAETLVSEEFQDELAAFQAMIDADGSAEGYFSTLGIYFSSFEAIEVVSDNLPPQSPVPGPVGEPGVVAFENDEGANFARFTARDPEGGALTFEVSDDRFEVVPSTIGNVPYILKLKDGVSLDHETEPEVTVVVTMTDPEGLSTSRTFNLDVHDAPPTAIALDNDTVDENAVGAVVGNLIVTDPDGDTEFLFFVNDARFEIVDGALKLVDGESLDFETEPTVSVAVTVAGDDGAGGFTETFEITVNDVNEAPLVYRPTDAAETLVIEGLIPAIATLDPDLAEQLTQEFGNPRSENAPGTYFGLLIANDYTGNQLAVALSDSRFEPVPITEFIPPDTELPPQLEADLEAALGADWSTLYLVKLLVSEVIDYETEPTVSMTATATDAAGTTSTTLDFEVEDVNEAPEIVRPIGLIAANIAVVLSVAVEPGLAQIVLDPGSENTPGDTFGILQTSDPDGEPLTVELSDSRFEAVSITEFVTPGSVIPPELETALSTIYVVKLKDDQMLDHEAEPSVPLTATVTDAGGLSASTTFSVGVGDVNEAPTAIALDGDAILDNTLGAVVGAVTVTDPDGDLIFDYEVSDDRFEVVGGVLKLKDAESLDFGTDPTVSLDVTATDPGDLSFTQSFVIDVIDVPEVAV